MRKVLMLFFVVAASLALFGCNSSEFKVDGEFLAYEAQVHTNGTPQVTYVTVTIEKGKIVGYSIDVRQGTKTQNAETGAWAFAFNAKTKKELGFDYNMKPVSAIGKEWFEQAAEIEKFWLANGVEAMTTKEGNFIDNVTGVSMKDAYSAVALKAIENAKAGKFQAIYVSGTDLYSVHMTVEKGNVTELILDTLQMNRASATSGTFTWNAQTKQQLGYAYRMHGQRDLSEADYKTWLQTNNKLEWFEQVNLITDDIVAKGWRSNAAEQVPAGVTITTSGYYNVLSQVYGFAGKSVK